MLTLREKENHGGPRPLFDFNSRLGEKVYLPILRLIGNSETNFHERKLNNNLTREVLGWFNREELKEKTYDRFQQNPPYIINFEGENGQRHQFEGLWIMYTNLIGLNAGRTEMIAGFQMPIPEELMMHFLCHEINHYIAYLQGGMKYTRPTNIKEDVPVWIDEGLNDFVSRQMSIRKLGRDFEAVIRDRPYSNEIEILQRAIDEMGTRNVIEEYRNKNFVPIAEAIDQTRDLTVGHCTAQELVLKTQLSHFTLVRSM